MIVAGVELNDGRRVWAQVAEIEIQTLDLVRVRLGAEELHGTVFLAPAQLMGASPTANASILSVSDAAVAREDDELPGANMPSLGSQVRYSGRSQKVTGIDPVLRTVTLGDDASSETVSLDDLGMARD